MLQIVPGWITEAEADIKRLITKIAQEQNINYNLVWDSVTIQESINSIGNALGRIKQSSKSMFTEEELQHFKNIDDSIKKKKKKRKVTKKNANNDMLKVRKSRAK